MNTCTRIGTILLAALLLLSWGCGGSAQPTPKEGVVYLDPNAPAAPQAQSTDAPAPQAEAAPAVAAATEPPASEPSCVASSAIARVGAPEQMASAATMATSSRPRTMGIPSKRLT